MSVIWWIGLPFRFAVAVGGYVPYSMLCGRWRTDLFWDLVLGDEETQ